MSAVYSPVELAALHPAFADGLRAGAWSRRPGMHLCPYQSDEWRREWRIGMEQGRHFGLRKLGVTTP